MSKPASVQETRPEQLDVKGTEFLPPIDRRSAEWFSRLGYTVSEAIADLIDNSIDARATKVSVRIVRSDEEIKRVLISDNGRGMTGAKLSEAMQFGGGDQKSDRELGKYGIGLKLASLSQAKTVTVLTKRDGSFSGRRWRSVNIAKGWVCEILNDNDVEKFLIPSQGTVEIKRSGTIVIWDDLEHLKSTKSAVDSTIQKTLKGLAHDLGLRFHRFISRGALQIGLDTQMTDGEASNAYTTVNALDPFGYPHSGRPGYPHDLTVALPGEGALQLECHIWPAKSNDPGYKLGGGKVSARQGFYFYRNDRLIQAGGWNGCRDDDSEPHLSLARVKVDLPATFDSAFKLDIKKSKVEPPPGFAPTVNAAVKGASSFKQFTADAQATYRTQKQHDSALFPFHPNRGFPAAARTSAKRLLSEPGEAPPVLINFAWEELDPDVLVDIDRDGRRIILNSLFRTRILKNRRASAADAPVIKILLLILFQDELAMKAISARSRLWLKKVNHMLVATLKEEE